MNYLDMFVIVLLIYAVFRGYTRGIIMQITQLAALLLGIYGALRLSGFTARQMEGLIRIDTEYLYLASLGITFLLVFLVIRILGKLTEKLVETAELSVVNRILGITFSLFKTILILGILLVFIDRFDHKVHVLPEGTREHSLFFMPFTGVAKTIFPSLGTPGLAGNDRNSTFV